MFVQAGEHRLFTREQKHIDKGFLHTHTHLIAQQGYLKTYHVLQQNT